MLGGTSLFRGELDAARTHLEHGTALYDAQHSRQPCFQQWHGPWGHVPLLCSLGPVAAGVSRASLDQEPRRTHPCPRVIACLQSDSLP